MFLPKVERKELIELKFILAKELNQGLSAVGKMPYHESTEIYEVYKEALKKEEEETKKRNKDMKSKNGSVRKPRKK